MPGFAFNGIHFVSWRSEEYASEEASTSIEALANTNANWAGLLTTWYQADARACTIDPDPAKTPLDEGLRCAVERMRDLGMKVLLKLHVDALDGAWRGTFEPANTDEWFGQYGRMTSHYADLAAALQVEALAVGTEFVNLTGGRFRRRWTELISEVRSRYGGLLTYAANAIHARDEFSKVSFWDAVDVIGLDAYFPVRDGWKKHVPAVRRVAEEFDKPVIFTEIGYRSVQGCDAEPWNWGLDAPADSECQARCYADFFEAWRPHASWMQGAFWWNWPAGAVDAERTDYSPRGKAACEVLAKHFEVSPEMARVRKVEEIRRLVQSGQYEVDPLAISRALLRRHLETPKTED